MNEILMNRLIIQLINCQVGKGSAGARREVEVMRRKLQSLLLILILLQCHGNNGKSRTYDVEESHFGEVAVLDQGNLSGKFDWV